MLYTIAWLNLMVAMLPHFTLCWPSVQWKIMYFEALVLLLIEQKAILGIELTFTTITLALIQKKTSLPPPIYSCEAVQVYNLSLPPSDSTGVHRAESESEKLNMNVFIFLYQPSSDGVIQTTLKSHTNWNSAETGSKWPTRSREGSAHLAFIQSFFYPIIHWRGGRGQIDTHFLLMYTTVKGLSHEMEFRLSNPQIDSNPVSWFEMWNRIWNFNLVVHLQ